MVPIGPAAALVVAALVVAAIVVAAIVVAALAGAELAGAALVIVVVAGLKAIGWELVILGFATGGAPGGMTFTLTNGGLEFAHAKAWRLVSKNLSMTIALRSGMVRP